MPLTPSQAGAQEGAAAGRLLGGRTHFLDEPELTAGETAGETLTDAPSTEEHAPAPEILP